MGKVLIYNSKRKDEKISSIISMQDNPREAALLAYMAGIFDGEGTVGIKKYLPKGDNRTMCYFLYLRVGMQSFDVINLFQKTFGGSLNEECVRQEGKYPIWRWDATGKNHVTAILGALLPYLIVKRDQALLALDCCNEWGLQEKTGRYFSKITPDELLKREDAYQSMRKLKHQEHPQRLNELALETAKR